MMRDRPTIDRDSVLMRDRMEKRASITGRELIELLNTGETFGHPIRSGSWIHVPVIQRRITGADRRRTKSTSS